MWYRAKKTCTCIENSPNKCVDANPTYQGNQRQRCASHKRRSSPTHRLGLPGSTKYLLPILLLIFSLLFSTFLSLNLSLTPLIPIYCTWYFLSPGRALPSLHPLPLRRDCSYSMDTLSLSELLERRRWRSGGCWMRILGGEEGRCEGRVMWWRRLFVPARSRPTELPIRKPPEAFTFLRKVAVRRGREGSGSGSSMSLVSPPWGRPPPPSSSLSDSLSSKPSQKPRGRQKGCRVPSSSVTVGTRGLRCVCLCESLL
jgi:hypothetical protein